MTDMWFFKMASGLYFLGTVSSLLYLARKQEAWARIAFGLASGGFVLNTTALLLRMREAGNVPLTNLSEAAGFVGWALVLTFLIIHALYGASILGVFILPTAFVMLYPSARVLGDIKALDPMLQSGWLGIHATLTLLGLTAFTVACFAGIMYLTLEQLLKAKRFTFLTARLPSLELLDTLNKRTVLLGFPLLTLGILTGALWAGQAWGTYWTLDPKINATFATWLFYLMMAYGRLVRGWRARTAALLAIIGFISVVFTFVGVNVLLKGRHVFV